MALIIIIPLGMVMLSFLQPQPQEWAHFTEYVLPRVLWNTLLLAVGVGLGVLVLGVGLAWLTSMCEFPGRRWLTWALMLPMAIPAYVLAFVHVALWDYAGPVQSLWREWLGSLVGFPPIRSTGGVVLVMCLALYPYVYLLARQAFLTQGRRLMEAAQTMGFSHRQAFWRVAVPMSRPWWMAGVTLALMETLADFGTVSVFNFDTFTTAIYKAWFSLFNLPLASQLATLLVLLVLLLVLAEHKARGARAYSGKLASGERIVLSGASRWLATGGCLVVWAMAFMVPFIQICIWAAKVWHAGMDLRYLGFIGHSVLLATSAALLVAGVALGLAWKRRSHTDRITRSLTRIATLGYAVPGMVLAVGIYVPIAWLDRQMALIGAQFGVSMPWMISGTLCVMLVALCSRFLAVGFEPIEAGFKRISRSQEEAARCLGLSPRGMLIKLYTPLLSGSIFSAALLVFVDVMKEMPITLMTRPFGWDTLAVRVFEMTSEGLWEQAALPSLLIVMVGLLPVIMLMRENPRHE